METKLQVRDCPTCQDSLSSVDFDIIEKIHEEMRDGNMPFFYLGWKEVGEIGMERFKKARIPCSRCGLALYFESEGAHCYKAHGRNGCGIMHSWQSLGKRGEVIKTMFFV